MDKTVVRKINPAEMREKERCLELLSEDRRKLLMRWPFIGSVMMRMELVPVRDDRLETACTDGNTIFVDTLFYKTLSKDERLFVLAHEVWHSVLLHFIRKQGRDRDLFNMAADLEIHFVLKEEKMKAPWVLPHEESWEHLSAEEIYERIIQSRKKTTEESFDKHLYDGEKIPVPGENGDGTDSPKEFVVDDDYLPVINKETAERVRGRVISAAQQMERSQGKVPGNVKRLLEKLTKPSLPWNEMLKQFVTSCYGGKRRWLPPSRKHIWEGLYLPSMRDGQLKAVAALDTSGSTSGDMELFFGELLSLMRSFGRFDLTVIQCDAAIGKVEHFSDSSLPGLTKKWEVTGGGGTSFIPVFDYVAQEMKEKPDLLIYFTDGFGPAPEKAPAYPVMWVLTQEGKRPADWGRVAHFKKQ
jgi:predicted metal-dependent peptidase